MCHIEEKFFGPAANVACSSLQLLGPEEEILRAGRPMGGRWGGALEDKKSKEWRVRERLRNALDRRGSVILTNSGSKLNFEF